MHPLLAVFLKLTLLVTIGLVAMGLAMFLATFLLKIVVVAAIIAALVMGGFFIFSFFKRQSSLPVVK